MITWKLILCVFISTGDSLCDILEELVFMLCSLPFSTCTIFCDTKVIINLTLGLTSRMLSFCMKIILQLNSDMLGLYKPVKLMVKAGSLPCWHLLPPTGHLLTMPTTCRIVNIFSNLNIKKDIYISTKILLCSYVLTVKVKIKFTFL